MKTFLILIAGIIGLFIAATAVMFIFQWCPPQGPWSTPPWCKDWIQMPKVELPGLPSTTTLSEVSVNAPSVPSQPSEKPKSQQLQSATAPYSIAFTVKVPENTPKHTVVYMQIIDGANEWVKAPKMEKISENTWYYKFDLKDFKNQDIHYRYMRDGWGFPGAEEFSPDSKTASRKILVVEKPKEINDTVEKWRWLPKGEYTIPIIPTSAGKIAFTPRVDGEKFQNGVVFADFWWNNFAYLLDSTYARMKEHNFKWVHISLDWNYQSGFGGYTEETFDLHLKKTKDYGLKVNLTPTFVYPRGETPTNEWWDDWFEHYEKFVMYFVDKANEHNVEQLVLGGDASAIDGKAPNYKQRLEKIYTKAKQAYRGKLGRMFVLAGPMATGFVWPDPAAAPFMENWDVISINFGMSQTTKNNPTQEELYSNVKAIFDKHLKPLYDINKKPIILGQVGYQTIDGELAGVSRADDPDTAMWEPYSDKYALDLEEQAMGHEAVMKNVAETNYIIGTYAFAYWPDEFPLSKENNVRGKPTEEVLSQWYKFIK